MLNGEPYSRSSFEAWIESARHGSAEALGNLLEACRPYLLLIANDRVGLDLQAKVAPSDLVQETFLEAQRDFVAFRGTTEDALRSWLRQILLHNFQNQLRRHRDVEKRAKHAEVSLEPHEDRARNQPVDPHDTPFTRAVARERDDALQQALAQLPPQARQVIEWRSLERCPFEEIGRRLDRSAEAARKLWTRAIERLQEMLDQPHDSG
jgi:RNA polymerase sigma-70 factor, ECF subfamily